MSNSKIDFINDLLSSPKIKPEEKYQLLELTKKEFKNFDDEHLEIKQRVDFIEEKIGIKRHSPITQITESPNSSNEINAKSSLPEYLNPLYLHDFLIDYNQDPLLKYTCHEIDDKDRFQNILLLCKTQSYVFGTHLNKIHKTYNSLTFKYQRKILPNIITLISTYLGTYNQDGTWSENAIAIKWTSPELLRWINDNVGKVPNPSEDFQNEKFGFNTIELQNGATINNFTQLVIYFKNLFHFKQGNTLKNALEESIYFHFKNKNHFNLTFSANFSERIELFTYSEALTQAFVKIVKLSKKYHGSDSLLNARLHFDYDDNYLKEFKIVILNSRAFGKHFSDFRLGNDITDLINKQVNGLCDFYIKAYFEDKKSVGIVNIWNGKPIDFITCEDDIDGVEFILKMY